MAKKKNNRNRNKSVKNSVNLDINGRIVSGRNPMANVFRYEYALYRVVSGMFASVVCRSMCEGTLAMYFGELPHADEEANASGRKRVTQESVIDEMKALAKHDVIGKINFPMMNICAAEACMLPEEDGSHSLVFSDGIYGFSLHLHFEKKAKHPNRIEVNNLGRKHPDASEVAEESETSAEKSGKAAHLCAA